MQNWRRKQPQRPAPGGAEPERQRKAVEQLAKSQDAQRLVAMLKAGGGVQEAAQAAAQGSPEQLMDMMNRLMNTREGAQLVERLRRQAEESGLS